MRALTYQGIALAMLIASLPIAARADGVARPELLLQETVAGMPRDEQQQVRVLTATLQPGDQTVFHSHRYPVTIYVLEGVFTLEIAGRDPIAVAAGQALVEPPNLPMTGFNRSVTEPMRVVIFYVSDTDTPFLDPIK